MTVQFFKIADDPRVLEKTLGSPLSPTYDNVNLLGSSSFMNPKLVLTFNNILLQANYFSINWGNTTVYYFMKDPILSPGGRCQIEGHEDVLYTNKDQILALHAYCSRCESKFERYAVDSAPLSLVTTVVTNLQFSGHVFSADGSLRQYLLTVKGGVHV